MGRGETEAWEIEWELTVYGSWERDRTSTTGIHVTKGIREGLYAVGSVNEIHRKGFISVVTQELNQKPGNNVREVILVNEDVVVSWLARAEQACMAIEIIIVFNRAHHIRVYDRARVAVPFLVTVTFGPREKDHFVVLGNDYMCDRGVEVKACTCVCELAVVRGERYYSERRYDGRGKKRGDGLRMRLSSSWITVLNSPSETPSWEAFVMLGHDIDIGQKPGITNRDRIKFVWAACPSIP